MSKILCIYHGHCDDGFAAAWCVRAALGESVEFYSGAYQKEPPDVTGRDVVMVDFSYKRSVMNAMAEKAHSILTLDHHKTAEADLTHLVQPRSSWAAWQHAAIEGTLSKNIRSAALFDMERCGATMAWDYFHGGERPDFLAYIEDRDLWRKILPDGDAFTMALRSYPQDFEIWDRLVKAGPSQMIGEGKPILRYYRQRIDELKRHAYMAYFPKAILGGNRDIGPFAICNAPYAFASEIANELCECDRALFGATFFEGSPGKFQYSLRSRGDFDVSDVAKHFGGGGHKNAAGFTKFGFAHALACIG